MNGGTGIPMIVAMVLLALGPARAGAGGVDQSKFRTEWESRLIGGSAPAVQGYVENHSLVRVGDVRLRIDSLDAAGQVVGESFGWVIGDVPANGRAFFVIRVTVPGATYRVSVESYDAMSESVPGDTPPAASPSTSPWPGSSRRRRDRDQNGDRVARTSEEMRLRSTGAAGAWARGPRARRVRAAVATEGEPGSHHSLSAG